VVPPQVPSVVGVRPDKDEETGAAGLAEGAVGASEDAAAGEQVPKSDWQPGTEQLSVVEPLQK
jgi:hypothetical protein